jgi:non-lysosomal glucosylceramidase
MRPSPLYCITAALVLAGLSFAPLATADTFNPSPAFQEPGDDASFQRLTVDSGGKTPTFKKIDPAWAKSLADRGEPTVYTKDNSKNFAYLGMPIGGIGAGELYLSGDGKLWEWDIFGTRCSAGFPVENGAAYVHPHTVNAADDPFQTVVQQGFVLRTTSGGKTDTRTLDKDGFADVKFQGQYPIGTVDYADPACPVQVRLEGFSPYNPGSVKDSTYPATILSYTITNTSSAPVDCTLGGWLENAVALQTRAAGHVKLGAKADNLPGATLVSENATAKAGETAHRILPIGDLQSGTYAGWTVEGDAFGSRPVKAGEIVHGNPVVGAEGPYFIDTYRNGNDKAKGRITSKPFKLTLPYLRFLIGGGNKSNDETVRLFVDGAVIDFATGSNDEVMRPIVWNVGNYLGKEAHLEIEDNSSDGWGHLMVDAIAQADSPSVPMPIAKRVDVGTMALASLGEGKTDVVAQLEGPDYAHAVLDAPVSDSASIDLQGNSDKLVSGLRRHVALAPGEKKTLSFVVAWYFPNPLTLGLRTSMKRQYSTRFTSAADVVAQIAGDFKRLADTTRLWHDTFYADSTLPWWFLDRTLANTSTLATSVSYYLADGRFYGYEGRYSCPGTCTHVWGYQSAIGFLFPDLDKAIMEKVEFVPGLGMNAKGGVAMRGEYDSNPPVDGQAGIILRTYLAHRMSSDDAFLKRNYASVKKAMNYLVDNFDAAQDGILIGAQANTMDAAWWGKIPWLSLHYQAALRATAEMADDTGDKVYATKLRGIADKGRAYIENNLWNGDYFVHDGDPAHPESPGTYEGCPLEQLMGQSWAYNVGLGDIIDPVKANKAIDSIWQYNYTTDAGAYRQQFPSGRWYALAGEPALVMCTFPRGGSNESLNKGNPGFSSYQNETWTGSEHELAIAMMWEGQVDKALAEERTINDRHNGAVRNPWDECECGSHYSRAMASFGVYVAACGFEYDGPKGTMAFAPRVHPEDFQGAFLAADGWGSFRQKAGANGFTASLDLRHGKLALKQLALVLSAGNNGAPVSATVAGKPVRVTATVVDRRVTLAFPQGLHLAQGQSLEIALR